MQLFHHCLSSLMQILRIRIFPALNPFFESNFNILSLKTKCSNLVSIQNSFNILFKSSKLLQLLLKVLQLWIRWIKLLETLFNLSLPQPVISLKAFQELIDIIFSSLNRSSQKENNLYNLLILSNPVVEWLSLVLWDIFLIPILDMLCGFKHMTSCSINSTLNFLKGWF